MFKLISSAFIPIKLKITMTIGKIDVLHLKQTAISSCDNKNILQTHFNQTFN